MKKFLLSLFVLCAFKTCGYSSVPLNSKPDTPDKIYQNDLLLQDDIKRHKGQIIQSSQTVVTASTQTNATTFVNSSITCTLSNVNSKSAVEINAFGMVDNTTATDNTFWTLIRGTTNLGNSTNGFGRALTGTGALRAPWSIGPYYDVSPGSGTVTYTVQIRVDGGVGGLCLSGNCIMLCQELRQ